MSPTLGTTQAENLSTWICVGPPPVAEAAHLGPIAPKEGTPPGLNSGSVGFTGSLATNTNNIKQQRTTTTHATVIQNTNPRQPTRQRNGRHEPALTFALPDHGITHTQKTSNARSIILKLSPAGVVCEKVCVPLGCLESLLARAAPRVQHSLADRRLVEQRLVVFASRTDLGNVKVVNVNGLKS